MKKIASLIMAVALLAAMLSVFAVSASAEGQTIPNSTLTWELTENDTKLFGDSTGLTLTVAGTGKMPDFETIEKRPWNDATDTITAVVINPGVTSIGTNAFKGFGFINKVTIPVTVVSIGDNAFVNCGFMQTLTIPDSVKNIGAFAFQNCAGLDEVTIPGSVESIGKGAFPEDLPNLVINGLYGSAAEKYARENGVAFKGTGTCSHIFCLVCDSCHKSLTKSDLLNAWGYSTGTGSTLSEGSLTIIVGIAAAFVFGLGGFILGTKKKKPALADGIDKAE